MDRLEEYNKICIACQQEALAQGANFDPAKCQYCKTGREVHDLEVKSRSKWTKVDWGHSRYKDYYNG